VSIPAASVIPPLAELDGQAQWQPLWIVDSPAFPWLIGSYDCVVTDLHAGEGPRQVVGAIIGRPTITRRLVDVLWGPVAIQDVTITFSNKRLGLWADGRGADYRLFPLTLWRYDLRGTYPMNRQRAFIGVIVSTLQGRGTFALECSNLDLSILETPLPKDTVERAQYPFAADLGAVIPWIFGRADYSPLINVRDDIANSIFDYALCRGAAAWLGTVYRRAQNAGGQMVIATPGEFYNVYGTPAATWADAMLTHIYPGYTALRARLRQEDAGNNLYQLFASCVGLTAERNPARAIRTILSDPTHGLGRLVDPVSFDAAEEESAADYSELVTVDTPRLLLQFNDGQVRDIANDSSGYEMHGTYSVSTDLLGGTDFSEYNRGGRSLATTSATGYVSVNDPTGVLGPGPGGGVTLEVCYWPYLQTATGNGWPILEKQIPSGWDTGGVLWHYGTGIFFHWFSTTGVRNDVGLNLYPTDVGKWIHIIATADATQVTLQIAHYTDPVDPTAVSLTEFNSTPVSGARKSGPGIFYVGHWGGPDAPNGAFDNAAVYNYVLTSEQKARHQRAGRRATPAGTAVPADYYSALMGPTTPGTGPAIAPPPQHYWRFGEPPGAAQALNIGTAAQPLNYIGTPLLEANGALRAGRYRHNDLSVRFVGDVNQYAQRAGLQAYDPNVFTWAVWYKAVAPMNMGGDARMIFQKTDADNVERSPFFMAHVSWAGAEGGIQAHLTTAANVEVDLFAALTAGDLNRWMFLAMTVNNGVFRLYYNGKLVGETTFAGPVKQVPGVFYVGRGGLYLGAYYTWPMRGVIDELTMWSGVALTDVQVASLYLSATWSPGGVRLGGSLYEQRQAQDWLRELLMLQGMRLGMSNQGAWTLSVDVVPPETMRLEARDGPGAGLRTLLDLSDSRIARVDDSIRTLTLQYHQDGRTNTLAWARQRVVHPLIGRDRIYTSEFLYDDIGADRVIHYLAARLAAAERTVDVTLTQEARRLVEGDLVLLTDAASGFSPGVVFEVSEVRKDLDKISATLQGWTDAAYLYAPTAFPRQTL